MLLEHLAPMYFRPRQKCPPRHRHIRGGVHVSEVTSVLSWPLSDGASMLRPVCAICSTAIQRMERWLRGGVMRGDMDKGKEAEPGRYSERRSWKRTKKRRSLRLTGWKRTRAASLDALRNSRSRKLKCGVGSRYAIHGHRKRGPQRAKITSRYAGRRLAVSINRKTERKSSKMKARGNTDGYDLCLQALLAAAKTRMTRMTNGRRMYQNVTTESW